MNTYSKRRLKSRGIGIGIGVIKDFATEERTASQRDWWIFMSGCRWLMQVRECGFM
jgi:hypothetical protein